MASRDKVSIKPVVTSDGLKNRFEMMLNNVASMLDRDGPIYSTWIYFQVGINSSKSITFNTASQDRKENLIASLSIEKTCSGIANSFTLTVQYDPFNMGQNSEDKIELLDEFIANAMNEEIENTQEACRCLIQYGYNTTSNKTDDELVSPLYELFLTSATSKIQFDSGITTYTFTGTSCLSADCDFVTSFPEVKDEKLLEVVGKTLYKYYGDPSHPPANSRLSSGITPLSGDIKYSIDISDEDIDKCVTISVDATSATQSPWEYCKSLLDDNPLTQEEKDSDNYTDDKMAELSINKRPRYTMYMTDTNGQPTIHIVHFSPNVTQTNSANYDKLNYVFSWGIKKEDLTNKNIVTGWNPEVDLYTYLIRKAMSTRYHKLGELLSTETDPSKKEEYQKAYDDLAKSYSDEVVEMYNAELELIGIPADPPMSALVEVIPRILESVSRTAGIYAITGASDNITNTGLFTSTLKLFRFGSSWSEVEKLVTTNTTAQETKTTGRWW